jgi:hypothetical protein
MPPVLFRNAGILPALFGARLRCVTPKQFEKPIAQRAVPNWPTLAAAKSSLQ